MSGSIQKKSASKLWLGIWERRQWGYSVRLEIKYRKRDSIVFSLQAFNGWHGGELSTDQVLI